VQPTADIAPPSLSFREGLWKDIVYYTTCRYFDVALYCGLAVCGCVCVFCMYVCMYVGMHVGMYVMYVCM
jgi:hypothetical protein